MDDAGPAARLNNFDLLRLIAAVEVLYFHGVTLLALRPPWLLSEAGLLSVLSGVPMFFVISGFLVTRSWERAPSIRGYAMRRARRIYPGLWGCLAFTVGVMAATGSLPADFARSFAFVRWLFAQAAVGLTTPAAVSSFGTGTPNGSLWTISVELTFYAAVPIIAVLILRRASLRVGDLALLALGVVSFAIDLVVVGQETNDLLRKSLHATVVPHLWLFVAGWLARRHFAGLRRFIVGRVGWWTVALVVVSLLPAPEGLLVRPVRIAELLVLVGWTLSVAFSFVGVSERLLRGFDLSYGVYLYHFVLINVVIELRLWHHGWMAFLWVAAGTFVLAALSWSLLESRVLGRRPVAGLETARASGG